MGALLFGWPWLQLQPIHVALILAFTFVAHIATNHVAFRLRIRYAKWKRAPIGQHPTTRALS